MCKGSGTHNCNLCGGAGLAPRLFGPPRSRSKPDAWRKRCATGKDIIDKCGLLSGSRADVQSIRHAARKMPAMRLVADRLEAQIEAAQALTKHNIETDGEIEFFKKSTGIALSIWLKVERAQLEKEEGYLKQVPKK